MRLDVFLAEQFRPERSRSQIHRMISAGLVTINDAPARAASMLQQGDRIVVVEPPPAAQPAPPVYPAPPIEVIFEDDELILVNKPAGMVVHQSPGHSHSTLVDALLARFPELAALAEPDGVFRPGIVHRLDKDTSGVMVVARTPFSRASLSRQFKEHTTRKIYLALVRGIVARDKITITRPLGRHPVDRNRMSVRSRTPHSAISHVSVLARFADESVTLVRVRPETGRTHQIRVHLASIGHACLGDPIYGASGSGAEEASAFYRQALHALALEFEHPRSGKRVEFIAPIPADFTAFLGARGTTFDTGKIRTCVDAQ